MAKSVLYQMIVVAGSILFLAGSSVAVEAYNKDLIQKHIREIEYLKQKNEFHKALLMTEEVRENFHASFELLVLAAELNREVANYDKAIPLYHKIVRINPRYVYYWTSLASCYEKTGKLEKAYRYYLQAVLTEPQNHDAANYYMLIAQKNKNPNEIYEDVVEKLVDLNSISAEKVLSHFIKTENIRLAVNFINHNRQKKKVRVNTLSVLANCYAQLNNVRAGCVLLKEKLDTQDSELEEAFDSYLNYVVENHRENEVVKELELLKEKKAVDKLLIAVLVQKSKRVRSKSLDMILEVMVSEYDYNRRLSKIAAKQLWGFVDSNLIERLKKLESEKLPEEALYLKATLMHSSGNDGKARLLYEQLIERNPSHSKYYYNLGVVSESLGEIKNAYRFYKNSLLLDSHNLSIEKKLMALINRNDLQQYYLDDFNKLRKERDLMLYEKFDYARRFMAIGLYKKGIVLIEKVLYDPAAERSWKEMGINLLFEYANIPEVLKKIVVIKRERISPTLYGRFGDLLKKCGEFGLASNSYIDYLAENEKDIWVRISLIECLENQGYLNQANAHIHEVRQSNKLDEDMNSWLAEYASRNKEIKLEMYLDEEIH